MDPRQIFAGVDIAIGRKPITLAALDDDFGLVLLEKSDTSQALVHLMQYKEVMLAINTRSEKRGERIYAGCKETKRLHCCACRILKWRHRPNCVHFGNADGQR